MIWEVEMSRRGQSPERRPGGQEGVWLGGRDRHEWLPVWLQLYWLYTEVGAKYNHNRFPQNLAVPAQQQ